MELTVLYIIIAIITLEFLLERILDTLNNKNWTSELPETLKGIYDQAKYKNSQEYDAAKGKLSFWSSTFSFVVMIGMLFFGGFAWVDSLVSAYTSHPMWSTLSFFAFLAVVSDIIGIPFELYSIFCIEEKFGFNKMTTKTFFVDKIKGWLLAAIIGGLLLSAFIWFHRAFPNWYWLYAWMVFTGFSLLMMMFYANLIAPIFNKLTPLESDDLRSAIEAYAQKVNFPLKNIMVMDGSKRSTKANAYFSGLGSSKNIVLYDTLIEKQSTAEVVAVLAHEVGHFKKKHILQSFIISSLIMLLTLYIMHLVVDNPLLSAALGAQTPKFHLGLIAFFILYSPLSTATALLMNIFSRKNEFEADAYAAQTSSASSLMSSLKKLSVDSLSNLRPHPAYVFFHYSHPPLLKRLEAMEKNNFE